MLTRKAVPGMTTALAAAVLLGGSASAQLNPINATGWDRDIIVENTSPGPYALDAASFDVTNNWAFYENALPGTTKGVPQGGGFNSVADASIRFQFQPYSGNNALFLTAGTPSGTLTLVPAAQTRYDQIAVVASSANGGGTGTLVITFTDSSTSSSINYNAQDWFNVTANNALNNLGRVSLATNLPDDGSASNPRMYQTVINLAGLGLNDRNIQSITFIKPAASNSTAVLAISGRRTITAATPVAVSGFNRDIVVENTAAIPYSDFASSFDTFNSIAWYENGLPGSTKGLPAGGSFVSLSSAAIQGQFQPYNAPNALFLDVSAPTNTLTFDVSARRPYDFLCVFASSSNMGGTGTMVINFTDASSSGPLNFNAQDWFNVTTNNALNNLGRVGLASLTTDDASAGNPRIYQTVIDMAALGLSTRAVESITFTKPNVGGAAQNTAVMAISGQPVPGVTGACSFPDGTCALLPEANCTGTYAGDNTSCPPVGACIAANGDCTIRSQANCLFVGGSYLGDASSCPAPGACIAANGDCTSLNSFQCAFQGGTFQGAGQPCPAAGACCTPNGCVIRNSFQCAFQGGTFQGGGSTCDLSYPAIVEGGGAFEDISGSGTEVGWTTGTSDDGFASIAIGFNFSFFNNTYTSAFVGTNGLITFGAGSTAFTNACPVPAPGAPNNAIYPYWDDFHVGPGTFAHPGRVYTETRTSPNRFIVQWNRVGQYNAGSFPLDENTFQAVLFENGDIEFRYADINPQAACDPTIGIENSTGTVGLNYPNFDLGAGNISLRIDAQDPCPTTPSTGACCVGTSCSVTESANCSGTFLGEGSVCEGQVGNPITCCVANFNGVGGVSVQDIYDFLTDWNSQVAGGPIIINSADVNGSGTVTVQDIYDFLAAWSAGCN